jgi:hypothetical protein
MAGGVARGARAALLDFIVPIPRPDRSACKVVMTRGRIVLISAFVLQLFHGAIAHAAPDIQLDAAVEITRLPDPYSYAVAPSLALDGAGRPHAAWWEWHAGGAYSVKYAGSADGGGTFGAPVELYASGYGAHVNPRVAAAGSDLSLIWSSAGKGNPGDVQLRHRAATATDWDAAVSVSSSFGDHASVAADASGRVVVGWLGFALSPTGLYIRRSVDGGVTWADRQLVAPGVTGPPTYNDDAGPQVALGPGGKIYLAYVQPDDAGQLRLWFIRSLDAGATFSTPDALSDGTAAAGNATLTVGASGAIHVAWEEGVVSSSAAASIVYRRSLDGGATFSPAQSLSADVPSVGVRGPRITEPSPGLVIAAFRNDPTATASDIVVRTSRDGGASFGGPETASDGPAHRTTFPALAGAADHVFVAWVDAATGTLRLRRGMLTTPAPPPPPEPSVVFADVPASYWARTWIETLYRTGVTGGCSVTPFDFCPERPVSREQMAVFLVKALAGSGFTPSPCTTPVFGDVPCSSPYAAWIDTLVQLGVTTGCGGGAYCPGGPVQRQQMAVFLLRALEGPGYAPSGCTGQFADVDCASPFAPWIEELVRRGIAAGCGTAAFCPAAAVTRAQMAVFLVKAFGLTP